MVDEMDRFFFFFKLNKCKVIIILKFLIMCNVRSVHDSLCVIKRTLESGYVVAGGGAVEIALSIYLDDFAKTLVIFHTII